MPDFPTLPPLDPDFYPSDSDVINLMRDREREGLQMHPALAVPGWAAQYMEVEDDEQELCDWCEEPITDDDAVSYCSREGTQYHPRCHYEAGCRCPG